MFNKRIKTLEPYVVSKRFEGRHDGEWLFLDWNETTYELPGQLKNKMIEFMELGYGVRYPDGDSELVLKEIAKFTGAPVGNILVFNGSDSALKDCIECLIDPGDRVGIVEPEYSQINTYVHMAGGILEGIKLNDPFNLDITELLSRLSSLKILYLSNPGNPTGRFLHESQIVKILNTGVCLLLDEAYVEFIGAGFSSLVDTYKNLFVFRTFSKAFGLAGLRVGYLISEKNNINTLKKNRNSKEINLYAQIAVVEALRNISIYKARIEEIVRTRDIFIEKINSISPKIEALPSCANFVVVRTIDMDKLLPWLEADRILIRDRRGAYFMKDSARISIGKPEEMNRVAESIYRFYKTGSKSG